MASELTRRGTLKLNDGPVLQVGVGFHELGDGDRGVEAGRGRVVGTRAQRQIAFNLLIKKCFISLLNELWLVI